jgi:hypothetical protein
MIRHVAGLPLLVLVMLPVLVFPSWLTGAVAVAAGLVAAGGLVALSIPVLTAGAMLALADYALALWLSARPPGVFGAVAFGVALFLALDVADFARRFRGAALDSSVVRHQARSWVASAATGALAAIVLTLLATAVRLAVPPAAYPAIAAAGALVAFAAVIKALVGPAKER